MCNMRKYESVVTSRSDRTLKYAIFVADVIMCIDKFLIKIWLNNVVHHETTSFDVWIKWHSLLWIFSFNYKFLRTFTQLTVDLVKSTQNIY